MPRLSIIGTLSSGLHASRHQFGGIDALSPTLHVGGTALAGVALDYIVAGDAFVSMQLNGRSLLFSDGTFAPSTGFLYSAGDISVTADLRFSRGASIFVRNFADNADVQMIEHISNGVDGGQDAIVFGSTTEIDLGYGVSVVPGNGDLSGSLGTATARWNLIRGVTITSGDYRLENDWYFTEAEKLGLGSGVALCRPDGSVAAQWN